MNHPNRIFTKRLSAKLWLHVAVVVTVLLYGYSISYATKPATEQGTFDVVRDGEPRAADE